MIGKQVRLERIIDRRSGRSVIVPVDHGATVGPIPGLVSMRDAVTRIVQGGADAVIMHKGMVSAGHRRSGRDVGLIIHLSASTALAVDSNAKELVCTVEEAIQLGADAVSIHVNLGADTESTMLRDFGTVARDCVRWGMPLLAMMYCRGPKVKNEYDVKVVKHAARVAAELGADIAKVAYTGTPESFAEVVAGCHIPVVIAGGEKMETDRDILVMVDGALKAGARGVSIGRNVFQHDDPRQLLTVMNHMAHRKLALADAVKQLGGGKPAKKK